MLPAPIEALLADCSPEVQTISRALRAVAIKALPQAHQFVYHAALNYALTDALSTRICAIAPLKTQVNLNFFAGEALPDPQRLLIGTPRRRLRHVPVKTVTEASNPALEDLLRAAWGQGMMEAYR